MAETFSPSKVLQRRLDALSDALPGVREEQVEAVHHTRVATRRLREVIPIVVANKHAARDFSRRLRDGNRELGPIRELDVLAQLITGLQRESRYSGAALQLVHEAVSRERRNVGGRLKSSARQLGKLTTKLSDVVADLQSAEHAELRKIRRHWRWGVQARVVHRASRVRSAIDHAGVLYASGPLHEVRVAIKKLRYAIELSDEIGERQQGAVTTLKSAQDLLGRQHDLEVFLMWERQLQLSGPRRGSWSGLAALTQAIESDCRELHARYVRERPALIALTARVGVDTTSASAVADVRRAG